MGLTVESRIELAAVIASAFSDEPLVGTSREELDAAERRLRTPLPDSVALAYSRLAMSPSLNAQDRFVSPSEFVVEDGFLVLRRENQGCATWGVAVDDACHDPTVVIDRGLGKQMLDAGRFSSFVVFCSLMEAVLIAPHTANAPINAGPVGLEPPYRPLRIEPFQFWPDASLECRLFGGPDTLIADHAGTWLWVGCLQAAARDRLVSTLALDWIIP